MSLSAGVLRKLYTKHGVELGLGTKDECMGFLSSGVGRRHGNVHYLEEEVLSSLTMSY